MSLITRNNYEAYLLDYVEETLSPELVAELMLFLEQHLDLKEVLEDFEIHTLVPKETVAFDKSALKKEAGLITLVNYEDFIIAEVEGINTPEKSTALYLFLEQNPEKQEEFVTYQKTTLVAPTIIFEGKKSLKKKEGVIVPMYWWYSSAAAVVIILFSLNMFNRNEQVYFPIADREEVNFKNDAFEESVIKDKIILEEKLPTVEEIARSDKKPKNKLEKNLKKNTLNSLPVKEEVKGLTQYTNIPKEKIKIESDTAVIQNQNQKRSITIEEENLYAENNVIITYEDEILDNGTLNLVKRKMTKLELVRAAVKHQMNGNLDKGKEKILFALNSKPLNFLKKRNRKE
ncbi:MAG: hypothetical protein JKY30_02140 [Flavobacteriales bacterium]|nr:hypothetical protein [Flavobacteriales bacterium]